MFIKRTMLKNTQNLKVETVKITNKWCSKQALLTFASQPSHTIMQGKLHTAPPLDQWFNVKRTVCKTSMAFDGSKSIHCIHWLATLTTGKQFTIVVTGCSRNEEKQPSHLTKHYVHACIHIHTHIYIYIIYIYIYICICVCLSQKDTIVIRSCI